MNAGRLMVHTASDEGPAEPADVALMETSRRADVGPTATQSALISGQCHTATLLSDVPCDSQKRRGTRLLHFVLSGDILTWTETEDGPREGILSLADVHMLDTSRLGSEGVFTLLSRQQSGKLYRFQQQADDVSEFVDALRRTVQTLGESAGASIGAYELRLEPTGEGGQPVLHGTLRLRRGVFWATREVRIVPHRRLLQWGSVGATFNTRHEMHTGGKALRLLGPVSYTHLTLPTTPYV